jgi:peptidoglycan-associated lipoprotein
VAKNSETSAQLCLQKLLFVLISYLEIFRKRTQYRNYRGEGNMVNINLKAIITTVLCVFLTTACSKQLMPPEIETSANTSNESDFTSSSENNSEAQGGMAGGFFSEEPLAENSSSFGSAGSNAFGQSGGGKNSSGSFGNNPFDSSNQSAWDPNTSGSSGSGSSGSGSSGSSSSGFGSSGSGSSGIQESRLQDFQASTNLKDIHFTFDKYDLDSDSKTILKDNAEYLKNNPGMHIEIQGHCDERGTNNYNTALGERRAQSTKQYLVSQGVDSSNVHVVSFGEEKPFCFESGESCWYKNRRAHFMVSK